MQTFSRNDQKVGKGWFRILCSLSGHKTKAWYEVLLSSLIEKYMFSYSGNTPLRHLVYRVLELPSSMQSLVYDFGQLDYMTEKDYAKKIVEKYVCVQQIILSKMYVCILTGRKNSKP